MAKKKGKIKKITIRDYADVLKDAAKIASELPSKTSLNSYIIDAIHEKNKQMSLQDEFVKSL